MPTDTDTPQPKMAAGTDDDALRVGLPTKPPPWQHY